MAAARSPGCSRRVSREHRPSLPTIMPIQPLEEAMPPVANRPDNPYSIYPEKLEVLERKEVVIVLESETAHFECKINIELNPTCTWYRNGIQIDDDERTTILNDGEWQRLHIQDVQVSDHGLYVLECRHLDRHISVHHRLYVCPQSINHQVFYHTQKYVEMGVRKHLTNTRVFEGETINLVATFAYEVEKYFWYKNNEVLHHDSRTTMIKHATRGSITITDAANKDTGIYYVIAITDHGYFSSFADVIVVKPNEKRPILPFIEEYPPEEVEGYIGEEVRICAKVQIDADSMIRWGRNKAIIVTNEVKQIDFGNNYIGLSIPSPKISSAGDYQLLMANSQIPQVVEANVRLLVLEPPPPLPMEVRVVQKLESAVACFGAQVSFDCSFELEDMLYFYVVWNVGCIRVERSNSLFTVVCGRGHFLLYIKSFEPGMVGEVICELRRAYTNHASVKVQRAYAHLTCIPPCVIRDSRPSFNLISKLVPSTILNSHNDFEENTNSRFHDMQHPGLSWTARLLKFCNAGLNLGCGLNRSTTVEFATQDEAGDHYILQIAVCKLDDNGLYFLNCSTHGHDLRRVTSVDVYEVADEDAQTLVRWHDVKASAEFCYSLEMEQEDGTYAEAGITHKPSFSIFDFPKDRIMVFRVYEVRPPLHVEDSDICLVPPLEQEVYVRCSQEVEYEDDFEETYFKTDINIGAGAFGSVSLVQNRADLKEYAAKIVKARIGRKRDHVLREFHIMKTLSHPKIIQLFGFYETPLSFIFVMEYCWGGELFERVVIEDCMREVDVVHYVRQICEALEYLNSVGIVHLDIKPENIICISPNSTNVKIIDFGVARHQTECNPRAIYGTKEYISPEILDFEPISHFSDMWSVGVVTYVLLSGLMPFAGSNWYERSISITSVNYDYNDDSFDEVSDPAKEFVDMLLIRRPEDRMSAVEALNHRWLREGPPKGAASKRMNKMRKNMKSYLMEYKQHWQSTVPEHTVNQEHWDPSNRSIDISSDFQSEYCQQQYQLRND